MPRRSLCCRTMPKSPSLSRRPSQTNTFSGVRSRCSVCPRCSLRSTSRMPAISRRAAASDQPRPVRDRKALRSPCVGVLEGQAVQEASAGAHQGKRVEYPDRARVRIQQLAEVGLAQPAVHPAADLDADFRRDDRRAADPSREVDLAEAAFAEKPPDLILQTGFRGWRRSRLATRRNAPRSASARRGPTVRVVAAVAVSSPYRGTISESGRRRTKKRQIETAVRVPQLRIMSDTSERSTSSKRSP